MDIQTFDDLLAAARQQSEPQRLLLVFVGAGLPADATEEQRTRHAAGESGELTPLMCVDKDPGEISSFGALADEASGMGADWRLVFAGALAGTGGRLPRPSEVEAALQRMVDSVKSGRLASLIPFDRQGDAVLLS
jgi:hypothetical protein